MIDIKTLYLIGVSILVMVILGIITLKRILRTKSTFSTVLMVIDELILILTAAYVFTIFYNAIEDYNLDSEQLVELNKTVTYVSVIFGATQIVLLVLIGIYRFINKRRRFIKNRRNIH